MAWMPNVYNDSKIALVPRSLFCQQKDEQYGDFFFHRQYSKFNSIYCLISILYMLLLIVAALICTFYSNFCTFYLKLFKMNLLKLCHDRGYLVTQDELDQTLEEFKGQFGDKPR